MQQLLARVRAGAATDAEREELALYAEDEPALATQLARRDNAQDDNWLQRVEADKMIRRRESGPMVRAERTVGLAMLLGGLAVGVVAPIAGSVCVIGGTSLLLWSLIRTRVQSLRDDPYKDIEQ